MNDRVQKLREQSINAKPSVSHERALLLTQFYMNNDISKYSIPVQRAMAFKYIIENKEICINDDELIVGERGPAPRETPTYPEICCHTLEDLDILNNREKTSFSVSPDTKQLYQETIIPFWRGKTIRERIFEAMAPQWKDAYEAGIFTEFQEQRAPGHTVLDDKIYKTGFKHFIDRIKNNLAKLDFLSDPEAYYKHEELKAMNICADALIIYADRYSQKAAELAESESDEHRKNELQKISRICKSVPLNPPRTFHEALQYYWFVHIGVITELNTWDSFNPGHLDQHLYPFYKKEIEEGTLTDEEVRELLQCFWIKFNNQPAPPKVGVTAHESGTYTDFALINTGGVRRDGSDAVNELSYMILDVVEELRILQPSSCVQISKKTPENFLKRALKIVKTGFGQPSIFNTDAIVQELVRQGKSLEDARCGGASGCVEVGAFGKENYNLTGYLNLVKILEITLNNGVDPRTGRKIGLETGDPCEFKIFDEFYFAFERQLKYFIDIKVRGNNIIERLYAEYMPAPFLSLLIDDCIEKGKDYHNGGARYNTSYIQGVGLGSITDCLASIKYNVFDQKRIAMQGLMDSLKNDFQDSEKLRLMLVNKTPKYGNDDEYADDLTVRVFESYYACVDGRINTKGGRYAINLLPTTVHIYFGSVTGATPDGRKAWTPLSEGISPVQGADRNGPTAVIKSVAKIDHLRTGGTLLNQKFAPQLLETEENIAKLGQLIRTYFSMDGHHIQFNVVNAETLRDAQKNPEKYRNLIVRVAGYSDYFNDIGKNLQDEIIRRTEHKQFS